MQKILREILEKKDNRIALIKRFQNLIWNGQHNDKEQKKYEILNELAYDLDFYEPDIELRKKFDGYYGDERLEEEIKLALDKIRNLEI